MKTCCKFNIPEDISVDEMLTPKLSIHLFIKALREMDAESKEAVANGFYDIDIMEDLPDNLDRRLYYLIVESKNDSYKASLKIAKK